MIEFEKPNITKIDENKDYGKFVIEPLERGYGTTLGNSLRRVLLASLPGAAVTSINIDGVLHEFDTVPGLSLIHILAKKTNFLWSIAPASNCLFLLLLLRSLYHVLTSKCNLQTTSKRRNYNGCLLYTSRCV